jgi:hypothetical protein
MKQSNRILEKIIAALEIGGALVLTAIMAYLAVLTFSDPQTYAVSLLVLGPVSIIFILLGFFGGWYLWQGKKEGYWLSILLQAFQIIKFTSTSFIYYFASGIYFLIGYTFGGSFGVSGGIGTQLDIYILNPEQPTTLAINVVALFFFLYLLGRASK